MRLSVNTSEKLYPDLIEKGGLVLALQSAFVEIKSPVEVKEHNLDLPFGGFPVYARVESNNRFSQVYIGSEQRMFSFDFWRNGVALGNGYTSSLIELAHVLHEWIETEINLTELSKKFPFVTTDEKAEYFEQGREVEWKWQECQRYIPKSFPELVPFLNEASRNPVLRQLFPFTSMSYFCFSRCTGYPYSNDCPSVHPSENNLYKVFDFRNKLIGEVNASEAVELVVSHLPVNSGLAKQGTAEDLEKAVFK